MFISGDIGDKERQGEKRDKETQRCKTTEKMNHIGRKTHLVVFKGRFLCICYNVISFLMIFSKHCLC